MRAILISHQVVRFPISPVLVLSLQWSAINPIPLGVISVSLQPNPRFCLSDRFLFHHQFVKEVVFFGWSDYSEVSSQVLTNCSSIAPFRGYSIIDVIAWFSVKFSPAFQWTICKAKLQQLCFISLSYFLILSYLILSYLILSYLILSYLILSYLILSYLIFCKWSFTSLVLVDLPIITGFVSPWLSQSHTFFSKSNDSLIFSFKRNIFNRILVLSLGGLVNWKEHFQIWFFSDDTRGTICSQSSVPPCFVFCSLKLL